MTTFHAEARALYQVISLEPYLPAMPIALRKEAQDAIKHANDLLEVLMRKHRGYWIGDMVMHGSRGPFLVDSFKLKDGFDNMSVMLRPFNVNGKPSAKLVWEYLDANLTLVTK